ncbi:hypothetical protein UFOVP591_24 [uncultured Caudovirales phage]|uniref:Uncharacterized protein n=1 Tax=uncultured Caudovirales phage TaxID=2100421 RepID=A0A6J5MZX8_9CAUD|nr:hypothetical protein UFOVP591_24 [uncultured Caudovirales phage]
MKEFAKKILGFAFKDPEPVLYLRRYDLPNAGDINAAAERAVERSIRERGEERTQKNELQEYQKICFRQGATWAIGEILERIDGK